jgi:NAD(P)-dependent dehydrogenase (short-subunit alcohol dehydrogenase family)
MVETPDSLIDTASPASDDHATRGRVALVTGTSGDIGLAVAATLRRDGFVVAGVDVTGPPSTPNLAMTLVVDVTDAKAVTEAVETVRAGLGPPEVLVTCAGIIAPQVPHGILALPLDEWESVIAVNLTGTMLCVQAVARAMRVAGRGGSIVTVSSIGASRPTPGSPAYHASKGGVEALSRAAAVSLAPDGIRVNCVAPGFIDGAMTRDVRDDPGSLDQLYSRVPMKRLGGASDVAVVVAFLASDGSRYMTGQTLVVDGGSSVLGWRPASSETYPGLP